MSITHSINGPDLGEAGWVAPHDIANGTITAAMLADAYDPAGAAAAAQAASQPLDSDLTAIAALTTTPYGRSLLTQANAAALRSTAALGTAAVAATTDFDAAGAAATAQAAAISTASADATTKANAAQAAAIAASDPSGSASTAQTNAEVYTDSSVAALVILSQAQVLTRQLGA